MPDVMTSGEVAELFRVAPKTVVAWSDKGVLPCFRTLGGHRRFRESEVLALYENGHPDLVRRIGSGVRQERLLTVCDICAGDLAETCSSCDGACVTTADLACPDCGGVGEVTPAHCCGCGVTADGGAACNCPPDE